MSVDLGDCVPFPKAVADLDACQKVLKHLHGPSFHFFEGACLWNWLGCWPPWIQRSSLQVSVSPLKIFFCSDSAWRYPPNPIPSHLNHHDGATSIWDGTFWLRKRRDFFGGLAMIFRHGQQLPRVKVRFVSFRVNASIWKEKSKPFPISYFE